MNVLATFKLGTGGAPTIVKSRAATAVREDSSSSATVCSGFMLL